VSVIDTATDTVVDTLQTGGKPRGAAATGQWLYVQRPAGNRLVLVDLRGAQAGWRIAQGVSPRLGRSAYGRWIAAASGSRTA